MKFTTAWASVARENVTLKIVILALSAVSMCLGVLVLSLGAKDALVIERSSSRSLVLKGAPTKHTEEEIGAFCKEALLQRFNSRSSGSFDFLSTALKSQRLKEQEELGKKNMSQTLIVQNVKVEGESITAEADRLIAVGKVRSAFPLTLDINLATVTRSDTNPYGLVLTSVSQTKEKEEGSK